MKGGIRMKKILRKLKKFKDNKNGFGMNEILGIAAAIIIAAFIVIPQLRNFANNVMGDMQDWWDKQVSGRIFVTSVTNPGE